MQDITSAQKFRSPIPAIPARKPLKPHTSQKGGHNHRVNDDEAANLRNYVENTIKANAALYYRLFNTESQVSPASYTINLSQTKNRTKGGAFSKELRPEKKLLNLNFYLYFL